MNTFYQYETLELDFTVAPPAASQALADISAVFESDGNKTVISGFYAGNSRYIIRFLPKTAGTWHVLVSGAVEYEGTFTVLPARKGSHGIVKASGTRFVYEDGTPVLFFGTTVYALMHQPEALIDETMETLKSAPFNKIRLCVFPKDYRFNHNEPEHYPFEKDADGNWDPDHPCFAFWDAFENRLGELFDLGIQVDLILFHPYDRWGFAKMSREKNLTYLDYLLRRFSAYPGIWWSMANEYDLCWQKDLPDWYEIEAFIHDHDPYGHLLSNHSCVAMYDAGRPYQTHISWQTKQIGRIPEMMDKYGKPVVIDECYYEGDLPEDWGSITGMEMTARFWRTYCRGGHCTHGETFDPGNEEAAIWWAKGGKLRGESPARIRFLRKILEELPGIPEPVRQDFAFLKRLPAREKRQLVEAAPEWLKDGTRAIQRAVEWLTDEEIERFDSCENKAAIHCGDEAFLYYYDWQAGRKVLITLPADKRYTIDVIDTWNMTRETVLTDASGTVDVPLPGKPYMAVLAAANDSRVDRAVS